MPISRNLSVRDGNTGRISGKPDIGLVVVRSRSCGLAVEFYVKFFFRIRLFKARL